MTITINGTTGLTLPTSSGIVSAPSGTSLQLQSNGTTNATLDTAGNLGLGVTPSAWNSDYKSVAVSNFAEFYGRVATPAVGVAYNAFRNSGGSWIYKTTNAAARYEQDSGFHIWSTAPSGTAGNAISFTQAMTLDASGNLLVGATPVKQRLTVGGGISAIDNVVAASTGSLGVAIGTAGSATGTADLAYIVSDNGAYGGYNDLIISPRNNTGAVGNLRIYTGGTERARIDSSGNLLVGVSSDNHHVFSKNAGNGAGTTNIFQVQNAGSDVVAIFLSGTSYGTSNSAGTSLRIGRSSSTSRSINAGGTINASGADYAEYMTKAGDFVVAKGDLVGINADGKLTNVFDDAVSFCVKSTDPSYVGGDVWGNEDSIGKRPSKDATDEEKAAYADALEAARQKVDRIAFAGQVPVNVMGATPGQYIVPVDDNGAIKGVAVSNPTFEQYQAAVGKVIAIEADGRAKIIVKVA